MLLAKVKANKIVQVAYFDPASIPAWASDWIIGDGLEEGMLVDGQGGFEHPVSATNPADYILSAVQFHTMIENIGKDQQIRQALNVAYADDAPSLNHARNKLERGTTFVRDDPLVVSLATAIGLTPEEVDTLWLQAKDF